MRQQTCHAERKLDASASAHILRWEYVWHEQDIHCGFSSIIWGRGVEIGKPMGWRNYKSHSLYNLEKRTLTQKGKEDLDYLD